MQRLEIELEHVLGLHASEIEALRASHGQSINDLEKEHADHLASAAEQLERVSKAFAAEQLATQAETDYYTSYHSQCAAIPMVYDSQLFIMINMIHEAMRSTRSHAL